MIRKLMLWFGLTHVVHHHTFITTHTTILNYIAKLVQRSSNSKNQDNVSR